MNYQNYLKNTINNNDFFSLRKSADINNRRIYDLKEFYQRRNGNNNIKNIESKNNYNNGNYQNYLLENKINNNNRSYLFINNNNKLEPFFANDIEAENNIGKYKENIINHSNIVEQNYKKFNEYQNQRYQLLNLKHNQEYPLIKNNDYYNQYNKANNTNRNLLRNKLIKSHSTGSIFTNSYYLSNVDNNAKTINLNKNKYMGKRKTDITDNELINAYDNNENGFFDYCNKKMQYLLDNKRIVEEKMNQQKINIYNSKLQEKKEIERKNNYFNDLKLQNMINLKNEKIKYKNMLDEQIKNNINNKLLNENLTFKDVIQDQKYLIKRNETPDRIFLNKNRFVDVNPYNHRNYFLGNSSLENNVILHPQDQFKTNRYIFPKNSTNN